LTIGYKKVIGGTPSSVSKLTEHLLKQTIKEHERRLAEYYQKGRANDRVEGLAMEVTTGEMQFSEALDILISDHIESGGDLDDLDEVERRLALRLDAEAFRIFEGMPKVAIREDAHSLALDGLGIDPMMPLTLAEVSALLAGRRADGEEIEGKAYASMHERVEERTGERKIAYPIGSVDFAPSPDKSVSVAWASAGWNGREVEQALFYNAHLQAAREAMAYIGEQIGRARRGAGGKGKPERGHIFWMEFTHHTARRTIASIIDGAVSLATKGQGAPGDPDLHTHFPVVNAVFCESGHVGSLDTKGLEGFIFEADLYYHARLATILRDAGYDVVLDERTGAAKLVGISNEILLNFSKRTNMGEALARLYTADRGEVWEQLSDEQRAARMKAATQDQEQKVRGEKDDDANFEDWQRQAKLLGWDGASVRREGPALPRLSDEDRDRKAYDIALKSLAEQFEGRAVIPHWELRKAALRGLIATRCDGLDDIDRVTSLMWTEGVIQYGERTAIGYTQEDGKRYYSVTTKLHESDEREFVELAKAAAADKSAMIPPGQLQRNIDAMGIDFQKDTHGRSQLRAMGMINTSGKFGVVTGVAGAGKSTIMKPFVMSWDQMGFETWGAALAWDRADDLVKMGIPEYRRKAFSVLLDGIDNGTITLHRKSVVVVDEWGMLGTRQGLQLLRHQAKMHFTIVSTGDDKQLRSIEAGNIFDLSRRVLGEENIPLIATTKRQKDREATILAHFRDNEPAKALAMKREDGDAEMVYGGREGVMRRAVEIYLEHVKATGVAPGIIAPTNNDAHQIGEMARKGRREMGLVGPDVHTLPSTDGQRNYPIRLAVGDRLRLFQSTRGEVEKGKVRSIGRNGSIMEVLAVNKNGMRLRNTKNNKVGSIKWTALLPNRYPVAKGSVGRYLLAYGDGATVHTSQGSEGKVRIFALPSGSQAIAGGMGYTGMTRGEVKNILLINKTAEEIAVRESRPINSPHEVTLDDCWANTAKNFIDDASSDSALALMDRVRTMRWGAVKRFNEVMMPDTPTRKTGSDNVARKFQQKALEVGAMLMARSRSLGRSVSQGVSR
jgi:hypothetical protein